MKIKCQECGTIIEIEDSEYPVGIEQTIECPLCQTEVSFTLNSESNQIGGLPPTLPVVKSPIRVKSRLVKKEDNSQTESSQKDERVVEADGNNVNTDWDETMAIYDEPDQHNYFKIGGIIGGIIIVLFLIGKYAWHSQSQPSTFVDSDTIEELVDSMAFEGIINESDSIISFLTSMYENSMYESYPFLNSHCTQHLLSVLSEAYDYDCNESPCYATWLFRTSAQDEKSPTENVSRVVSVMDVEDNWFEVEFYDGGWKGVKRIKAYFKDDVIVMDIIETVYDEASENMKNIIEVEDSTDITLNNGTFPISVLYERKLNESDIEDIIPKDLELLRNLMFARHGYRFSRDDLMSYFSKFSWYTPSTDDASEIYENMTEIEKYNVEFIKDHE